MVDLAADHQVGVVAVETLEEVAAAVHSANRGILA